jgi:hypothetical protein
MWLPTFLQRGIHFFGERTEVLAFNNFVLFDRVHLPMIGSAGPRSRRIYCLCEASESFLLPNKFQDSTIGVNERL